MMEFGKTLRTAREAKGYTVLQLAEMTRLAPSVIENLENEDFSRIAAPIYGRGFVKLYCEAVGLVPKPLVDQFMDILNGNHEPRIRERPVAPEPPAPAVPEATPAAEPVPEPEPIPEPPPQQDLFRSRTPLDEKRDFTPVQSAPDPEPTVSKYATTYRTTQGIVPQRLWRMGALACVALAILVLLLFGLRALHRATSAAPADTEESQTPAPVAQVAEPVAQVAEPAAQAKPAEPRTAQDIPSLYID